MALARRCAAELQGVDCRSVALTRTRHGKPLVVRPRGRPRRPVRSPAARLGAVLEQVGGGVDVTISHHDGEVVAAAAPWCAAFPPFPARAARLTRSPPPGRAASTW